MIGEPVHILVAGRDTEQLTDRDFVWTVEGELVMMPPDICDCPDCGCERSVVGLASSGASTMFQVIDHPAMQRDEYCQAFADGLARQGYGDVDAEGVADYHLLLAANLPPGELLEIKDGYIWCRSMSDHA